MGHATLDHSLETRRHQIPFPHLRDISLRPSEALIVQRGPLKLSQDCEPHREATCIIGTVQLGPVLSRTHGDCKYACDWKSASALAQVQERASPLAPWWRGYYLRAYIQITVLLSTQNDNDKGIKMKHSVVASGHNAIASPREGTDAVQRVSKAKLLEERAKKLSDRFGLRISTWEWRLEEVDETVLRTDKPICMRARWTCHRCATAFASFTICPNCDHARCTKCSRFPPEHERPSVDNNLPAGFPDEDEGLMIPDYNWTDAGILLTRPSKTGGQDLILKKPRRRVRRSCHECHTQFAQISKTCQKCGHIRCTDCPREP